MDVLLTALRNECFLETALVFYWRLFIYLFGGTLSSDFFVDGYAEENYSVG